MKNSHVETLGRVEEPLISPSEASSLLATTGSGWRVVVLMVVVWVDGHACGERCLLVFMIILIISKSRSDTRPSLGSIEDDRS